ncbi:hypothetical protein Hanom_Chr14g01328791 [Helianthus anomalus]
MIQQTKPTWTLSQEKHCYPFLKICTHLLSNGGKWDNRGRKIGSRSSKRVISKYMCRMFHLSTISTVNLSWRDYFDIPKRTGHC